MKPIIAGVNGKTIKSATDFEGEGTFDVIAFYDVAVTLYTDKGKFVSEFELEPQESEEVSVPKDNYITVRRVFK